MELRTYQKESIDAVYTHLRDHDTNPCIVIPTAGGKTPIIATICRDAVQRWNGRVLIVAHVKELLEQAADKLQAIAPALQFGIYSAGLGSRDTLASVIIAGVQSAYRCVHELGRFDLVIIDEAHMLPIDGEGMYRTLITDLKKINPALRVIGLTATPYRMQSGSICSPENVLQAICYEIGVRELITQGFLCPLVTKAGKQKANFDNLHVRGGEFVSGEVEKLMDDTKLVDAACREILEYTSDRHSVLIFSSGVQHGEHIRQTIERLGMGCRSVFGDTLDFDRAQTLTDFKAGKFKYLVNVNVLTTGFDAPNIDCVAMLRPTLSPGLYYQMCLDMETEVMTPKGWARCHEIEKGDSVAAFDLSTGGIDFCTALEKVHRLLRPGETMFGVSAPHLDIRVTDLHTMIYRGRGKSCHHWRKRDARDLADLKDSFLVPVAGASDGPGIALSDNELCFLGWAFTDGHRNPANNAVIICQSASSPHLQSIEATLRGCGFGYRTYSQRRSGSLSKYAPAVQYVVPYGEPRGINSGLRGWKHLAEYFNRPLLETLTSISRRQLRVMLEAMNLGDGNKHRPRTWTKRTFDICLGEHKYLADQLQALFVLRGFRCNVSCSQQRTAWHSSAPRPKYMLHIREQQVATIGGSHHRGNALVPNRSRFGPVTFDSSEMIWCLTTQYGTLVTRRRGKVCVVGNCGRGFRLHPSKQNCLVLDFGGNVMRHGPVDAIQGDGKKSGDGEAPSKECPECHSVIAAGFGTCPDCGFVFPPREKAKHENTASDAGVLTGQVTIKTFPVDEVTYSVHTKRGAPPDAPRTLRVDYRIGFNRWQSEWVCVEHDGFARQKAEKWWRKRSDVTLPNSASDACELAHEGALRAPVAITIKSVAGDNFDRITGYDWASNALLCGSKLDSECAPAIDDIPF